MSDTDRDELVDAANDLTVAITEALLEETALDEDTDIADIERWGERTEKLILARIQADAATIAGMQWQPIETAPKGDDPKDINGPPILIWQESWPTGYEGFWYAHDQAWYLANLDSEYGSPEYPTHWMPLPNPPALKGNDHG